MLDGFVYRRGVPASFDLAWLATIRITIKLMFIDTNDREHSLFPLACLPCNVQHHSQYSLMLLPQAVPCLCCRLSNPTVVSRVPCYSPPMSFHHHHASDNITLPTTYAVARFTWIALNVLPWTERHSAEPAPSVVCKISHRLLHVSSLPSDTFTLHSTSIGLLHTQLLTLHDHSNPGMPSTSQTRQTDAVNVYGS
jgi:hypothetical protein